VPSLARKLQRSAGVSRCGNSVEGVAGDVGRSEPYHRHRPEQTVLFRAVQEHWRSFVEQLESEWAGPGGLPHFVSEEIEAFLRCGLPAHGLIVARCRECGWSRARKA
jgi:hypothetical protein